MGTCVSIHRNPLELSTCQAALKYAAAIPQLHNFVQSETALRAGHELKVISHQYPCEPLQYLREGLRLPFAEGIKMLQEAGYEVRPVGSPSCTCQALACLLSLSHGSLRGSAPAEKQCCNWLLVGPNRQLPCRFGLPKSRTSRTASTPAKLCLPAPHMMANAELKRVPVCCKMAHSSTAQHTHYTISALCSLSQNSKLAC